MPIKRKTFNFNPYANASVNDILGSIRQKAEGTTTTYGQNATSVSPSPSPTIESSPPKVVGKGLVPSDTMVKVVQQTEAVEPKPATGKVNILSSTSMSRVFIAAASSNAGATVVLPQKTPSDSAVRVDISQAILGNFSKVIPRVSENIVVKGSSYKTKLEQKKILTEAQKVDLSISLKSPISDSVEINLLKVPKLETTMVYNFFDETEEDISIQEDQSIDPLLFSKPIDVPRYVNIVWTPVTITQPLSGMEVEFTKNKKLREETFTAKGGVIGTNSINFKNSVSKSKKNNNTILKDGVAVNLTDVHEIEKGFNSISNQKSFSNTISAIVNIEQQKNTMSNLPIKSVKKT